MRLNGDRYMKQHVWVCATYLETMHLLVACIRCTIPNLRVAAAYILARRNLKAVPASLKGRSKLVHGRTQRFVVVCQMPLHLQEHARVGPRNEYIQAAEPCLVDGRGFFEFTDHFRNLLRVVVAHTNPCHLPAKSLWYHQHEMPRSKFNRKVLTPPGLVMELCYTSCYTMVRCAASRLMRAMARTDLAQSSELAEATPGVQALLLALRAALVREVRLVLGWHVSFASWARVRGQGMSGKAKKKSAWQPSSSARKVDENQVNILNAQPVCHKVGHDVANKNCTLATPSSSLPATYPNSFLLSLRKPART